jgi:adenylylsulfate kinase-like enzyme
MDLDAANVDEEYLTLTGRSSARKSTVTSKMVRKLPKTT